MRPGGKVEEGGRGGSDLCEEREDIWGDIESEELGLSMQYNPWEDGKI
jgi:hypothetical protein